MKGWGAMEIIEGVDLGCDFRRVKVRVRVEIQY